MGGTRGTLAERLYRRLAETENGCVEWQGARTVHGYGRVRGAGRTLNAHRLAYELAHGEIPAGMHVLHRCDNPPCCNPDHLFIGTQADNNRDMYHKGRGVMTNRRGERHPAARLTNEQAREIRQKRASDRTYRSLAEEYGVSFNTAYRAARGETSYP